MIVAATLNDTAQIVELVNIAYRSKDVKGWTSESEIVAGDRINAEHVQQLMLDDSKIFLMFDDATLIGCVHIQQQDQVCYIGMLTTHPHVQNRGIGKQLLNFVEAYCIEKHRPECFEMSVLSARTELIAFYNRRGYQLTDIVSAYPLDANVGEPLDQNIQVLHLRKKV